MVLPVERFSPWLYVCPTLLALSNRWQESVLLANDANNHRRILDEYNLYSLNEMLSLISSTTLIAYALYTFSAPNVPRDHLMMLTLAFVVYGPFWYMYLIHVPKETTPPDVVLWAVASALVLNM